jgi:tetratricopeptide (TPR) repeat protein
LAAGSFGESRQRRRYPEDEDKDAEAIKPYRKALAIREQLVAADAGNPEWQRLLASSCERLGDALRDSGRRAEALDFYRRSLTIREELAEAGPGIVRRQSDLTISHERIANELLALGQRGEAITLYRKSLGIRERLLAADPDNPDWRLGVAFGLYRLGLAGDGPRDRYARALEMLRELEASGKLAPSRKGFIAEVSRRLAALPN